MLRDFDFNLYLIRHGESEVNVKPDEMGQSADVKLTSHGEEQAKLLGKHLAKTGITFNRVFSSPYTRAYNTAKIVLSNSELIYDRVPEIILANDLREYDAGEWTGGSRSKTLTDDVKRRMNVYNMDFQPPGGESMSEVENRSVQWLNANILYDEEIYENFIDKNDPYPIDIACFSHGMTIKCLLHHIMGFDKSFTWKISILNTSVTRLHFNYTGWGLDYLNDVSHLIHW